jgi:hypothetical protein
LIRGFFFGTIIVHFEKTKNMKKLALLTVIALAGFTSCKKCQTCTTKVVQETGIFPVTTSTSEEYCGDEYDDAPAEVSVVQDVGGGISQTVTIECVES